MPEFDGKQLSEPRLSLFQIETELLGLIEARADAQERRSQPGMQEDSGITEELATIDGLIRDYMKREVAKVDGIALTVKEFAARAKVHKEAAEELLAKARHEEETVERIKAMVLNVMQEVGEKKFQGRLYTLARHGNGGVRALTVAQPDLVPLERKCCTIELRADVVGAFSEQFAGTYRIVEIAHPDNQSIRLILEEAERAESEIKKWAEAEKWTPEQIATAMNMIERVPGCRLEERGEHLRIK